MRGSGLSRRELLMAAAGAAMPASGAAVPRADAWERNVALHPAGASLAELFAQPAPTVADTGLRRRDYLPVIAGIVDFFRACQSDAGAIVDPYERAERQYATPAFALAAALVAEADGREELREPAARAFDFALRALAGHTTADGHADFYIPMLMHALPLATPNAPRARVAEWRALLRGLTPERAYRDTGGNGNWNLVNVSGECLRRKAGLVSRAQGDAQAAYVARCLDKQQRAFARYGMYEDPNAPLAYDAFPRLWLEDMMAAGGYDGPRAAGLREWLTLGGLSTLLLLSPSGEWACGGRSSNHQWNEAQVAVIAEVNARRWRALGRADVAGAFKRAAHLALTSIRRWRRTSGELWIVKNRADPARRFGYEGYSFHSQYNLLAAAMLAIAYGHADDRIAERALPSEYGCYVFDLRDVYHKICLCAGGVYALVDTGADPHYNATGLLRVHRAGVGFPLFSNNPCAHRVYGPPSDPSRLALAAGLGWREGADGPWRSLADFPLAKYADKAEPRCVTSCAIRSGRTAAASECEAVFALQGSAIGAVRQTYRVADGGLEITTVLTGAEGLATRAVFPVLVSDGASDTTVTLAGASAGVRHEGAAFTAHILEPGGVSLRLEGPRVPTQNGYMQACVADLPPGASRVTCRIELAPS